MIIRKGLISLPIHTLDPDFPIIQYVDDTLLIVPGDSDQLDALKSALQYFTSSTDLAINFINPTYCQSMLLRIR
jgi:hypothetical protein